MEEISPRVARRLGALAAPAIALLTSVFDFVLLLLTYLAAAAIVPGMLGEVAAGPARFAAWIALVKAPISFAHLVVVGRRGWMALMTGSRVPDPPAAEGWRRAWAGVRDSGADAVWSLAAALIVFRYLADPGDARLWLLLAVTVAGPFLLPRAVAALFRVPRWWWRRRRAHDPRPAGPDDEPAMSVAQADRPAE